MDWIDTLLAFIIGIGLRVAIPVAVTVIAIYLLRRLDARWQAEADQEIPAPVVKPECWKIKECPPEQRKVCPAITQTQPCWQFFRKPNGYLQETCLGCDVFRQSPPPVPTRA